MDAAIPAEPPVVEASPRAKQLILVAAGILYATGTFGSNVGPAWVDDRPELLLAFSSRNRNLFASVPFIDPIAYSLIGFSRLMVVGLVFFFVGRWFAARFIAWSEEQLGELPGIYRWSRSAVDKAGWLLVLLMPGSMLVCLATGWRRMRPALFAALLAVGSIGKLIVLWVGGKVFEDQIKSFLDAISDYQWWLVGAFFAIWVLQMGFQMRKSMRILAARDAEAEAAEAVAEPVAGDDDRH